MDSLYSRRSLLVAGCALPLLALPGCSTLGGFSFEDAIRRILTLSSQRAFARLLQDNGFFQDELARIPLPPQFSGATSVASAPADMIKAVHLCRGNFRSSWAAEGGYEPVAEVLFNDLEADAYFLEYDDERSGDFAPLRFVPPGKTVVLGLVTSKRPVLESQDELLARIDEAAAYVPADQLCLSPQCGFASTLHGNVMTEDDQWAKLGLVVQTAARYWG